MQSVEFTGNYVPSALYAQLQEAGLDVRGVTCTEDDSGSCVAVQVQCGDGVQIGDLGVAVAKYSPPKPVPAQPALSAAALTALILGMKPTATVKDLQAAVAAALPKAP
jgi:hypothetical protein